MPGTTRYSATFDRPYEEEEDEDLPAVPPLTRRSRSASWQATTANGRPYTPLGGSRHVRSSSTDNGAQTSSSSTSPAHSTERIPTRTTGKVSVKTSHNPFQFVKVGTCPLYKKAEELLKKTQKVKQPEALKEEEEEWQSNLDSWKSRRRKMSQDVFRRQEEMKELLEMEEQPPVAQQKKVKTFSEMVKDGANRGRTVSLSLFSSPPEMDNWGDKDGIKDDSEMSCNDTHQSSGSAESSNVNSEDDNDVFRNTQMTERNGLKNVNNTQRTRRTGAVHFLGNHNGVNNGISPSTEDGGSNCDFKVSDLALNGETHKCEPCQSGAYNDSGLDSLSSSHRAGDIPDSGSDFSQDSGSSLDCDSPGITGIPTSGTELLEEFSSKDVHPSSGKISHKEKVDGMELCLKLTLTDSKSQQYGFTINGGKDKGLPVTVASVINGSVSDLVGLKTGDHILAINKEDISSLSHSAVISSLKQSAESKQLELLLWRPVSSNVKQEKSTLNGSTTAATISESLPKKSVTEQISIKTISKATKGSNVTESSVDNRVDIADSQSNNKKAAPVKQKDLNCKTSAPAKSQTQEPSGSASEVTKSSPEAASVTENQHVRSVESENEMFVDDFPAAPVSNNSKIPVAEKSPKIMGKKISKSSQEAKKNKSPLNDTSKSDESSKKAKESVFDESKDSSLNIIYQSQSSLPKTESNAKELVSGDSGHSVSSSVDKKVENDSPKSPVQASTNKQEPKFNEKLTFEASEILPVDKVAEQMERLILEQLEEEERLKEKPAPSQGSVVTTTTSVQPEHELSGIDTPPRQVEPPKEKPPPPPSSSTTSKDSPLNRVNSTKRIKKEMQKRRSDFLGIEKSEEEESVIPPPPDLENILKLECEQERKVREMLGTESLHQRESSFEEEEEIARKEREIIENLETEERMRMVKQTVKDESISSSSSDTSFAQVEVERIRKLQEERVRMEEERFLKEEQRIRLEEERQLREREEQIRREEALKTGDLPTSLAAHTLCVPAGITKQFGTDKAEQEKGISLGTSAGSGVGITTRASLKEDPASKNLTTVLNVSAAASSHIQTSDTNKKLTAIKKSKPESKKSKTDKQNIISKGENKTSINSEPTEPQSQIVQPSVVALCITSENIPTTVERGVVSDLKSTEISKSSTVSQNVEQSKITAPQSEGTQSDTCITKQKVKAPEVSKNFQQNKQTASQNENAKSNKKLASEFKSKDTSAFQNKDALQQSAKSTSVSQQESEVVQVSQSVESIVQQNGDIKSKMLISKQKFPASEISLNVDSNKKATPCDGGIISKKRVPVKQPKVLETPQYAEVQAADSSSKTCAPEQKSNDLEISCNFEQNKKTALQGVGSKPNSVSEPEVESGLILQNVEQKLTSVQAKSARSKICTPQQTSKTSEVPLNVEQNKISDRQHDSTKSSKNSPVQKLNFLDASRDVEKKQTVTPVESSSNKVCVSEQNSKTLPVSQNIELNKQTVPQVEAVKTDKSVPEQKPPGNIIRVRKKKKVIPAKPTESENSNAGVSYSEPANQNSKCPLLPTTCSKHEDQMDASLISGKQTKENSSNVSGVKAAHVNCAEQKFATATQNECGKPLDQKNNSSKETSHSTSSVAEKIAECKTSSNSKVESATDVSTITSSATVLTTNSENIAPVSSISSSVSNDASLSQTGDGKNKETVCMPSASGDQSSITKETTNNLVPTKPLKKKEVIRKERERLRQEQEALQREREEYRRQMMKEQELLKESQKPHAPDAPVSRVGAPPPLKPALPLPLTSLPHASQVLKENVIYTSRSPATNSMNAAVGSQSTVVTSQSPSLLSPSHNTAARPKLTQNDAWGSHKVPVVKKQPDASSESRYNQNHWLIQEAEMRRISEQKERQRVHPSGDPRCVPTPFSQGQYHPMHIAEENYCGGIPNALHKPPAIPGAPSLLSKPSSYPVPTQMHSPEQQWNYGQPIHPTPQNRKFPISSVLSPGTDKIQQPTAFSRNVRVDPSMQAPTKPSRVIPMDRQEQMLSVSGRKRCSHCGEELGRGAAMIIESLQLYYHIQCFRCCVCQAQLGNGSCGTDVRVRNNKLHCHNCYSNDEAGLKFSQV